MPDEVTNRGHEDALGRTDDSAHPVSPRAILAALRAEIPGFDVVERDAELSDGGNGSPHEANETDPAQDEHRVSADWVATDRSRRLLLAGARSEGDHETILWAVETVGIARRMRAAGRPIRSRWPAADATKLPLVVLVVPACSARLLSALALLPPESLALFEVHSRKVSGRAKTWLVRRDPRGDGTEPSKSGIEAWPAPARAMAESLSLLVRRIDPSIELSESALGLRWSHRDEEALTLSLEGGRLVGACGEGGEPAAIDDEAGADAWLERALRQHCARLRSGTRVARPADILARGGPLLTPEELAAFRDD